MGHEAHLERIAGALEEMLELMAEARMGDVPGSDVQGSAVPPNHELIEWHHVAAELPPRNTLVLGRRASGVLDIVKLAEDGKFYSPWEPGWPIETVMWTLPKGPG